MLLSHLLPAHKFVLFSLAVQLSVTIGIMLAYLLGLFVEWRILAVLGNHLKDFL